MMPEKKDIIVYTGPVQTGKTTAVIEWAKTRKDIYGIAQPVIEERRYLTDLNTNETRLLETDGENTGIITVGKFKFLRSTFEWAKIMLLYAAKQKPGWLIIDEFGKLELKDKGLEPVVTYLVNNCEQLESSNLLIVIRDYLLDNSLSKLSLSSGNIRVIKNLSELI